MNGLYYGDMPGVARQRPPPRCAAPPPPSPVPAPGCTAAVHSRVPPPLEALFNSSKCVMEGIVNVC